jgi:hypothetical protein
MQNCLRQAPCPGLSRRLAEPERSGLASGFRSIHCQAFQQTDKPFCKSFIELSRTIRFIVSLPPVCQVEARHSPTTTYYGQGRLKSIETCCTLLCIKRLWKWVQTLRKSYPPG